MPVVLTSLLLAVGQLGDRVVLRLLVRSLAVSLALFALIASAGWLALDAAMGAAGLSDTLFEGARTARGLAAALLAAIGLWFAWRIVAMAVVQFFADEIVAAVELRHYPQAAARAREPTLGQQVSAGTRSVLRALVFNGLALPVALALAFTAIGPALVFFIVNATLLGRELQDMVWQRHRGAQDRAAPVGKLDRLALGGAVAALLMVPFANFLAPVLGAAAATHLVHRKARP